MVIDVYQQIDCLLGYSSSKELAIKSMAVAQEITIRVAAIPGYLLLIQLLA
jgi:hypothetical protein